MATFFSGQWIGTWAGYPMTGTLTGDVSRSGNTVTLSNLNCTWTATYGYGSDSGSFFRICDGWDGWNELVRATGLSMNNGSGSKWIGSCSVTVGTTDTSHSFTFRSSDGAGIGFTVTFASGGSSPDVPTVSASVVSGSRLDITWGTTSLGSPTGNVKLYYGTSSQSTPSTLLATKTTTGNSTYNHTGLYPNKAYYYMAYAENTIGSNTSNIIVKVTAPAGISSVTATTITDSSAVLAVSCKNSQATLTTKLQSSTDGSTWTDIATSVDGRTISVTLTGLSPKTSYTRYFRVHSNSGNSDTYTFTFTTLDVVHFYGSVSNATKEVKKMYGSVSGQTKKIKKFYGSVNGVTKLIYRE